MSQTNLNRRSFFKIASVAGAGIAASQQSLIAAPFQSTTDEKPATNIDEALKHPRTEQSLPGKYPGQVVQVIIPIV